jgi:hypothetical protein
LVERLRIEDDREQPLSLSKHPTKSKEEQEQPVMQEFTSFTGAARRLDGKAAASIPIKDALLCKKSSNRQVLQQMLDQAITPVNMGSSSLIQVRLMLVTHQEH